MLYKDERVRRYREKRKALHLFSNDVMLGTAPGAAPDAPPQKVDFQPKNLCGGYNGGVLLRGDDVLLRGEMTILPVNTITSQEIYALGKSLKTLYHLIQRYRDGIS